jgi:hypothetical protein
MRPTVAEQLRGLRRILAEVVAPEVGAAYPADMLQGVIANLEMLERTVPAVAPFLAWDNDATASLLDAAAPLLGGDLAVAVAQARSWPPVDPLDVDALHARNVALRGLLADAVAPLAAGGEHTAAAYDEVRAHLRARMARYPLTMAASMPSGR